MPTYTADRIGAQEVSGAIPTTLELWGSQPADVCTGNSFYGCSRASGGGNVLNPIQSARLRTAGAFSFKYGRLEVEAKLPKGDWIWPAIWLLPEDQVCVWLFHLHFYRTFVSPPITTFCFH
jgi:beta-glucanase (GH16 family)